MKHISLAFAGVVAGSMALSAQAGTTEWWAESFTSTDYQDGIISLTNNFTKGTWTMREGDTSYLAASYSNDCAAAIAPTVPSDVLVLNTEGQELTFAPTNATPVSDVTVVDADVFFVGSDTEPNLSEDTTVQFALFLKVPEDTGANGVSNSVMVYVRDEGVTGWIALEDTDIADKSWHHVRVEIQYDTTEGSSAHVYIDGTRKTPVDGYTLANGATTYTGLNNVSFKGTGAVDNFTGGFKVAEAAPLHTFTATAYVNGSVTNDLIAAVEDTAAGTDAQFLVPRTVDGKTITNIVVKALATGSDVAYAVTDDGTDFSVEPSGLSYMASAGSILITISTEDAADTGSAQTYPALEVYYASAVVPPTTYTADITLPTGYTLAGVKVNNVAQDPLPSLPMTVNDGDVVEFTYTNADGVSKTATVTIDGDNATATTEAYTWADYLGAAVDGAYEIDNLAELKLFQLGVANTNDLTTAGTTFKLTDDITLDAAWPGIGLQNGKDGYSTQKFNDEAFLGTFDGQNHTISGFQMVGVAGNPKNNGEGLDYCGFFNSTYGATIQNLKIAYAGSLFAADTTSSTKESGATFVGVAKNSTLRNLTTVAGTVSCSKGFGGIVGFLTSGTSVDSCTNNLNMTSLAKNKCGGIAMITQGGSAVTISNCQNNGTQTTGSDNSEYGAIVGYVGLDTTIANCETTVGRFLKHQTGTVTLQGVNKGDARVLAYHGIATPGLNFATVDGNVATFVADNALAAGNIYKVMGPSATATYEFAAAGSISFDEALATPTYAITAPGLDLTDATEGTVKTYTAAEPAPVTWTITFNDYDSTQLFVTNDVADNATGYGPATDPTRAGYTFVGWTNSVAGGATYATANLPAATADATYTAVYEEEVAPVTPAVDIGGGLAGYTPAPGETVPPPVAMDNNGFNASFVAPVAGYYCLMTASTPSGDDADYAVDASTAEYAEAGALVTLTDSNTSATSKFYKIGYSATEIK